MRILAQSLARRGIGVCALPLAAPVAAQEQARAISVPVNETIDNPCTEELVTISGAILLLQRVDEVRGQQKAIYHLNTQGLRGVGTSGAKYVFAGQLVVTGNVRGEEGSDEPITGEVTLVGTTLLVRQGETVEDDDELVHITFHITITPDGEVRTQAVNVKGECR